MLGTMCERGPDSAGFAIYGDARKGKTKITVQSATPSADFANLTSLIKSETGAAAEIAVKSTHAVLTVPSDKADAVCEAIRAKHPSIRIMGVGENIEIYKEVGYPTDVIKAVQPLFT